MGNQGLSKTASETERERRVARRVLRACGCVALMGAAAVSATPAASASSGRFAGASAPAQTVVASSRGVVGVRLVCPRGTVRRCIGTASLQTQKKRGVRIQKLGSAHFSIASGKQRKIKVSLNEPGRVLLAQGKVSVMAVVASRDGQGHKATTSRKITLESQSYVNPPPSPSY